MDSIELTELELTTLSNCMMGYYAVWGIGRRLTEKGLCEPTSKPNTYYITAKGYAYLDSVGRVEMCYNKFIKNE